MTQARLLALALLLLAPSAEARGRGRAKAEHHDAFGSIKLGGQVVRVRWSDGDSFNFQGGEYAGRGTRLMGYNTLEAYGPVHRWGKWTPQELYDIAKRSSSVAAGQVWECTGGSEEDGFGRLLIDCPELTREMVRQGHGMVYFVEGKAPKELLQLQQEAQRGKVGMWAKGVPKSIITSVHSADEKLDGEPYNRVVDTRTGAALPHKHRKTFQTCQEVCEGGEGEGSCMTYVPFENRYHHQPECLKE